MSNFLHSHVFEYGKTAKKIYNLDMLSCICTDYKVNMCS